MEFQIKRFCAVCGRVHTGLCKPSCTNAPRNSQADKFRNTQAWKRTARLILERDKHCCRVCLERGFLVNRGLSVHHITPLSEDYEQRFDEQNLITLCRFCHERAERGAISRERLKKLTSTPPILADWL